MNRNRFIKNWPEIVRFTAVEEYVIVSFDDDPVNSRFADILAFNQGKEMLPIYIEKQDFERVKALVPDGEAGEVILTTYALLKRHIEVYKRRRDPENWAEIRAFRERIGRITTALRNPTSFCLQFRNSELYAIKICSIVDRSGKIRYYELPIPLWSSLFKKYNYNRSLYVWDSQADEYENFPFTGDFEVTARPNSTLYRAALKTAEKGLKVYQETAKWKVGERNTARIFFRDKLNALYLYIKEAGIKHPLELTLEIVGLQEEHPHFRDCIGRNYVGKITL